MNRRISHGQAMWSVLGRARVTHFMVVPSVACAPSCGPLAEQEPTAMLVQSVEDCAAQLEHALVVEHKRETSTDDVEPRGAGLVETVVSEVGLVHDPSEIP